MEVVRRRGVAAAVGASVLAAAGMVTVGTAPAAAAVVVPGNEVLSWGSNDKGQLGNGKSGVNRDTPGPVLWPDGTTIIKVDTGNMSWFGLGLASSGLVYAWGDNTHGSLGDGSNTDRDRPVQVEGLPGDTTVIDIAAGSDHGLALTADQRLYAWGEGDDGELGNGRTVDSNTAVEVTATWPENTTFKAIAAGGWHNMALTSTGDLYVWGLNEDGQLGDGTTTDSSVPKLVTTLPETVTHIAGGGEFSVAVLSTGDVYAWGAYVALLCDDPDGPACPPGEVPLPDGAVVKAVSAGGMHGLLLTTDGTVLAWGDDRFGQLGDGPPDTNRGTPVPVWLPEGARVGAVSAGGMHSLVITTSGEVLAWGTNGSGALGDGTTKSSDVPVSVLMPAGAKVRGVAAGFGHSLALVSTGPALDWGDNTNGQLGNNRRVDSPVPVEPVLPEGVTVADIDGGFQHSLVATEGGHVYGWGHNNNGQLGDPDYTTDYSDHPIEAEIVDVVQVAGGQSHSLALTTDGDVYAWGANGGGQLGLGHTSPPVRKPTPVLQTWPDGVEAVAVAAGDHHSLALLSNGTVFAWGDNSVAELGNGEVGGANPVPDVVLGLEDVTITGVDTGTGHGVALADTGEVFAWGANSLGQMGSGSTGSPQPVAQKVTGLDGVTITEVAAGFSHTLALDDTGHVHAWGLNSQGQLGNNGVDANGVPAPVEVDQRNFDGASVVSIAGGNQHSLAVDSTGKPYGWGANNHGQVGDGTQTVRWIPVAVKLEGDHAGATVSQVAGGQWHSLAR